MAHGKSRNPADLKKMLKKLKKNAKEGRYLRPQWSSTNT